MTRRAGYTLIELVVSMAAAATLMVGLASCLHIAFRVFDAQLASIRASKAAEVQADIMRDLGRATIFTSRSSDAVTFKVPDENGDNVEETISYSFDPNGELSMTFNGTSSILLRDLSSSQFSYLARSQAGSAPVPAMFDVSKWGTRWDGSSTGSVVYEEFTEEKESSDVNLISVDLPGGTVAGDLLILAVAFNGQESFVDPSGWTRIHASEDNQGRVSLGVWWKIADSPEAFSHSVAWSDSDEAYGWMMRFTGHNTSNPIEASANAKGNSISPTSPAVSTSVDNCLILRLGAFDRNYITTDDAGVTDHTTITMDSSSSNGSSTSGGAAYATLTTAGDSGSETFQLSQQEQFVTVTIAIAPEAN